MREFIVLLLMVGALLESSVNYLQAYERIWAITVRLQRVWYQEYREHVAGLSAAFNRNVMGAAMCLKYENSQQAHAIDAAAKSLITSQRAEPLPVWVSSDMTTVDDSVNFTLVSEVYLQHNDDLPSCYPNWYYRFK